jgi:hypothetical protein
MNARIERYRAYPSHSRNGARCNPCSFPGVFTKENLMSKKYKAYWTGVAAVEKTLAGLSRKELDYKPAPEAWSIREIVAHLLDTEIAVYTRFRSILADEVPFLVNNNEASWAGVLKYNRSDIRKNMALFTTMRKLNYDLIASLDEKELDKVGLHSTRGVKSIKQIVETYIVHVEKHVGQMKRNLEAL